MRVRDIMTENVQACHPDTDLAAVAKLMWDHDDFTTSDLQSIVEAIVDKAFIAGRMQAEAQWARKNLPE